MLPTYWQFTNCASDITNEEGTKTASFMFAKLTPFLSDYDSSPPLIPFGVYGDPGGVPLPTLYNGGGGGTVMQARLFCLSLGQTLRPAQ